MITENGTREEIPAESRVEQLTEEVRARIEAVAEQANIDLGDVQMQMRELGQQVAERAATAKERIVVELRNLSTRIVDELDGIEDEESRLRAASLARELDRSANYLEDHTLEEVGQDVTETAQQNVWQALGIAFFIGLLVGLIIGSSRR